MIKIAICDDDPEMLNEVEQRVRTYLRESKNAAHISSYQSGDHLSYELHEKNCFDLILLDVEMPKSKNGMEVAAEINEFLPHCLIIFLTSHSKYAMDAFKVSAFRYNLKSRLEEDLPENLEAAIKKIYEQSRHYYTVVNNNYLEKVSLHEILYIQKEKKNSVFYTRDKKTVKTRKPLADVFEEISSEEFVYIDRSCIANIARVDKILNGQAYFEDGTILPISRSNVNHVKDVLHLYWGSLL